MFFILYCSNNCLHNSPLKGDISEGNTVTLTSCLLGSQSAGRGTLKLPFRPPYRHGDACSRLACYGCWLDRLISWLKVTS